MTKPFIAVQNHDFSLNDEYQALSKDNVKDGAVVTFVGLVRDFNEGSNVNGLFLEHYPGMTEKCLGDICAQANQRWALGRIRVIHRIGQLDLGEQIVFVGVTSGHRQSAFAACEFIMDYLKTQAPFWKKESTTEGERWIEAKTADQQKAKQW
ncbi:MAG: molybdopterin synthase catalytic subunit [Phenylobacterium sp.]|jgi:molybdopterin synthase catalytic subunit